MKKIMYTITLFTITSLTVHIYAIDTIKPSLLRSTSSLPKETQRIIAQLELEAAKANQSSFEAEDAADKKEIELKQLEEKSREENNKIEEISSQLAAAQKALNDAQQAQNQAIKDSFTQKNLASDKTVEASTKKKEIAKIKKDAAQAIASANAKPTEPAKATQQTTEPIQETPHIADAKKLLDLAKKYSDGLDIVAVKDNLEKAQTSWASLVARLADAHKAFPALRNTSNNTEIQSLQSTLAAIQQSVAKLFGELERQITLISGNAQHELLSVYETWGHQWVEHPLGIASIKATLEEFFKKIDPQYASHHAATPEDDQIAPPPAY